MAPTFAGWWSPSTTTVKPRLSPDGRKVVFTRYLPDGGSIIVVNVDGTGLR